MSGPFERNFVRLRPPRCVSTGPVVVRLAERANERERERNFVHSKNALNLETLNSFHSILDRLCSRSCPACGWTRALINLRSDGPQHY